LNKISRTTYPLYRGPQSFGIHNAGTANRIPFNILSKVSCCFVGFRGGKRFKFIPIMSSGTSTDTVNAPYMSVSRKAFANNSVSVTSFPRNNVGFANEFFADNDTSLAGMVITSPPQGGILEIELPWYSQTRFDYNYFRGSGSAIANGYELQALSIHDGQNDINMRVFGSVADDFNVFGFTGIPTIYFWPG
jgi:hypothetical protein